MNPQELPLCPNWDLVATVPRTYSKQSDAELVGRAAGFAHVVREQTRPVDMPSRFELIWLGGYVVAKCEGGREPWRKIGEVRGTCLADARAEAPGYGLISEREAAVWNRTVKLYSLADWARLKHKQE